MITLTSTNPHFSWIIKKNPETQRSKNEPFSKALRKGMVYSWFSDDQTFRVLFLDSATESSFNTISDFEYLDRTRIASPFLPIALIGTMLASAQKEDSDHDVEGFDHSIEFIADLSSPIKAARLARFYPEIELHSFGKTLHRVRIRTNKSIKFLLNLTISFMIVHAVIDDSNYVQIDDESIKKYIKAMNHINAPYYFRYILSMVCIKSPSLFASIKDILEDGKFIMNFGDTQNHRYEAIKKQLTGTDSLFDIGCGELFYSKRMASRYQSIFAFDADEEIQKSNAWFVEKRGIKNIQLKGRFDSKEPTKPTNRASDVLMTEVIEHMPKEDAYDIVSSILDCEFNRFVVTVPNRDFNAFYGMDPDSIRHPDHHWEPSKSEFEDFVNSLIVGREDQVRVCYFDVGDAVLSETGNRVSASLGVIFEKV